MDAYLRAGNKKKKRHMLIICCSHQFHASWKAPWNSEKKNLIANISFFFIRRTSRNLIIQGVLYQPSCSWYCVPFQAGVSSFGKRTFFVTGETKIRSADSKSPQHWGLVSTVCLSLCTKFNWRYRTAEQNSAICWPSFLEKLLLSNCAESYCSSSSSSNKAKWMWL